MLKLQKRIVRIVMGARTTEYCREYLKKLNILPLQLRNILAVVLSVIIIKTNLQKTLQINSINNRNKSNFH